LAAILSLAPWLPKSTAREYAKIIRVEAARRNIHPYLFVAFATVESTWNAQARSATADFGLMQVHVARRGSARFLGREHELFRPRTNIREWGRLAAMWKGYHKRTCEIPIKVCDTENCTRERLSSHVWWAHLKWGYRPKDEWHAMIVGAIFDVLLKRFPLRHGGEV